MHTPPVYTNCLRVRGIRVGVKLGCEAPERANPQAVEFNLAFYFPALTGASLTDSGDFVCYDKISHAIKDLCESREFRLIEFLGHEVYKLLRARVAPQIACTVELVKCHLPVAHVLHGASFTYSDVPPGAWLPPAV